MGKKTKKCVRLITTTWPPTARVTEVQACEYFEFSLFFSTRCIQSSKKLQINEGRTCECSLLQSEFVKFYLFFGFWQLEPWFGQIRPQQQVIFFVQKYQSDSELWLSLKTDIIFASVFVEVLHELVVFLSKPSLFLYVVLPGRWWWISFLGGGEFEHLPPSECLINHHAQVTLALLVSRPPSSREKMEQPESSSDWTGSEKVGSGGKVTWGPIILIQNGLMYWLRIFYTGITETPQGNLGIYPVQSLGKTGNRHTRLRKENSPKE